jgi:two-component system chemotaxis response regulator CheB
MTTRILIVDDSSFFCSQLIKLLDSDPDFEVVGVAHNGVEAIDKAVALQPDVITMDVEMPLMDGITATQNIMKRVPTPILMLSSLTYEGARLTLDALNSGAVDFYLKSYEALSEPRSSAAAKLRAKVRAVSRANIGIRKSADDHAGARQAGDAQTVDSSGDTTACVVREDTRILLMGASTGGPIALQHLITALPASLSIPVVVIQHMPENFTGAFAYRLNRLSALEVKEAVDGEPLLPGCVYVAPGGRQTYFLGRDKPNIRVGPADPRVNYQPCVDVTFASAARIFEDKVLALVLTGMGADGREGARVLKSVGAQVWAQDEASCVVYGMPMAVVQAGLADKQMSLDAMREAFRRTWDEN